MSHLFQSTRPVWGATGSARADWLQERLFQSTRPVWGATKGFIFYRRNNIFQSTRPVWGATSLSAIIKPSKGFQSTRPVWGATPTGAEARGRNEFQSTRPVWGATQIVHAAECTLLDFNPRAPCGARRKPESVEWREDKFQSTRPVWGATYADDHSHNAFDISIHAPRVGRDRSSARTFLQSRYFNPRAPCGARLRHVD